MDAPVRSPLVAICTADRCKPLGTETVEEVLASIPRVVESTSAEDGRELVLEVARKDPARAVRLSTSTYTLERLDLSELAPWPGALHLPRETTSGSVLDTASRVRPLLSSSPAPVAQRFIDLVQASEAAPETTEGICRALPLIAEEFADLHGEAPPGAPALTLDDGNSRALVIALQFDTLTTEVFVPDLYLLGRRLAVRMARRVGIAQTIRPARSRLTRLAAAVLARLDDASRALAEELLIETSLMQTVDGYWVFAPTNREIFAAVCTRDGAQLDSSDLVDLCTIVPGLRAAEAREIIAHASIRRRGGAPATAKAREEYARAMERKVLLDVHPDLHTIVSLVAHPDRTTGIGGLDGVDDALRYVARSLPSSEERLHDPTLLGASRSEAQIDGEQDLNRPLIGYRTALAFDDTHLRRLLALTRPTAMRDDRSFEIHTALVFSATRRATERHDFLECLSTGIEYLDLLQDDRDPLMLARRFRFNGAGDLAGDDASRRSLVRMMLSIVQLTVDACQGVNRWSLCRDLADTFQTVLLENFTAGAGPSLAEIVDISSASLAPAVDSYNRPLSPHVWKSYVHLQLGTLYNKMGVTSRHLAKEETEHPQKRDLAGATTRAVALFDTAQAFHNAAIAECVRARMCCTTKVFAPLIDLRGYNELLHEVRAQQSTGFANIASVNCDRASLPSDPITKLATYMASLHDMQIALDDVEGDAQRRDKRRRHVEAPLRILLLNDMLWVLKCALELSGHAGAPSVAVSQLLDVLDRITLEASELEVLRQANRIMEMAPGVSEPLHRVYDNLQLIRPIVDHPTAERIDSVVDGLRHASPEVLGSDQSAATGVGHLRQQRGSAAANTLVDRAIVPLRLTQRTSSLFEFIYLDPRVSLAFVDARQENALVHWLTQSGRHELAATQIVDPVRSADKLRDQLRRLSDTPSVAQFLRGTCPQVPTAVPERLAAFFNGPTWLDDPP